MVQNGFIKVFKKLDVYNFEGSLDGWIRRIMVNTAIDQIRKNKRDPFVYDNEERLTSWDEAALENEDDEQEVRLKAKAAIAAIQHLPPAYKTVFNMYVMEG